MPREEPYCETCDGTDIIADATAQWNADTQEWELADAMCYYYCPTCDGWSKYCGWREVKGDT